MHANAALIRRFYTSFQARDAQGMIACYAPDVHFSDPVFRDLHGQAAGDMWRMLTGRAQNFSLEFDQVGADDAHGTAHWIARYEFGPERRPVINDIRASFLFKDGLIVDHQDQFDLWRWSAQALGWKGRVLGWTPLVQGAIRRQAMQGLVRYQSERGAAR